MNFPDQDLFANKNRVHVENEPVEGNPYIFCFSDIQIVGFTNKSKHARVRICKNGILLFPLLEFVMSPAMHIAMEKKDRNALFADKKRPEFYISFRKVDFPAKNNELPASYYWVLEVLTPSYNPKTFPTTTTTNNTLV